MIPEETEQLILRLTPGYDYFFWGKKSNKKTKERKTKTPLTEEERAARSERRQQFWSNLGGSLKEGGAVSNLLGLLGGQQQEVPADYTFGLDEPEEKEGTPTVVWVIGGIAVLGIGYFLYSSRQTPPVSQPLSNA